MTTQKVEWILSTKKADFKGLAGELGVDQVVVRLMRNRDLTTKEAMLSYLRADISDIHEPEGLKDVEKAAKRIYEHIQAGHKIMIANDFDCDGISSGYILLQCLRNLGADVYVDTPDRCQDGYGINERLVQDAYDHGVSLIITCDNGIAALKPAALAAELGMEMIITDHHECPFVEVDGQRSVTLPVAYAIVNPKQPDCPYPFKGICGAVVAWKLMQVLYRRYSPEMNDAYVWKFLEIAAMATVADVMELRDENRALVRLGLKQMTVTENIGLKALIQVNGLEHKPISAYHIGFVIGPCLNASGRLASAKLAVELLCEGDIGKALKLAGELKELNDARKSMTLKGVEEAKEIVEKQMLEDKVLLILLEDCHESLAGIIAGRIRECYHRPTIVLTRTENGLKGSGRSIEAYNMFERISAKKSYLDRFGGHAMACGLSIQPEKLEEFAREVNGDCQLTEEDLIPRLQIDMQLPIWYLREELIQQIEYMGPYGNGNPRPLFAERGLSVDSVRVLGANRNVLKLKLRDQKGNQIEGISFQNPEEFFSMIRECYGEEQLNRMTHGMPNEARLLVAYEPSVNEFRGMRTIELNIKHMKCSS